MAKVHICNVRVLDEVAKFTEPYRFEITFDVLEDLKHGTFVRVISSISCRNYLLLLYTRY